MDPKNYQLEELFRNAAERERLTPSPKVLRQLRFKLWLNEFLSPKPKKVNIFYVAVLAGSITIVSAIVKKTMHTNRVSPKQENSAVKNTPEKAIVSKKHTETAQNAVSNPGVKPEEKPIAGFVTNNTDGCAPLKVKFMNHSVSAASYLWDFGDGKTSAEQNPEYTYRKAGNYKAMLTVTDKAGEKTSFSRDISVYPKPSANISIDAGKSNVGDRRVVFENNSKEFSNCTWNFGDTKVSTDRNVTHSYENYGIYSVTLIVVSDMGCRDTAVMENKFIEKDYRLAFPQVFRPNTTDPGNNGFYSEGAVSAIFYPRNFGVKKYSLDIYAPNGLKVFSTNNIQQGWNGYIGGRPAPGGTYDYSANGFYPNGQPFDIKGQVKVIVEDYYQN